MDSSVNMEKNYVLPTVSENDSIVICKPKSSEMKNDITEQPQKCDEKSLKKSYKVHPEIVALFRNKQHLHDNIMYKCPKCDKPFMGLLGLKLHFNFCVGWKPKSSSFHSLACKKTQLLFEAKCALCKKIFPSLILLKAHMPKHGLNQCAVHKCGKKFATYAHQDIHLKKHIASMVLYTCPVCEQRFLNESMLTAHCFLHVFKTYHCPECDDIFPSFNLVIDHVKKHSEFRCKQCQTKFFNLIDLVYHQRSEGPYACCHCQKKFASFFRLSDHYNSIQRKHLEQGQCFNEQVKSISGEKITATVVQYQCNAYVNPLQGCQERMKLLIENRSKFFFYCKPNLSDSSEGPTASTATSYICEDDNHTSSNSLTDRPSSDSLNATFVNALEAASAG